MENYNALGFWDFYSNVHDCLCKIMKINTGDLEIKAFGISIFSLRDVIHIGYLLLLFSAVNTLIPVYKTNIYKTHWNAYNISECLVP